jgi:formate hydrogenlyase subunit 4
MILLKKLALAILSCSVYSLAMAFFHHTPISQQKDGVLYFSISDIFLLFFLFSILIFVIGGIPFSIMIDKIIEKMNFPWRVYKYALHVTLYILAGLLVGTIYTFGLIEEISNSVLLHSAFGAATFYVVSLSTPKLINFLKGNH